MKRAARIATVAFGLMIFGSAWAADDAKRFATKAAAGSIAEMELADLALERASNSNVKALASQIKQDHEQAQQKLRSLAAQKQLKLPEQTDAKHKREKDRLAKLQGSEFDDAYVRAMIKEHQKDVKAFERQAKSGKDAEFKGFANETLPKLRTHLDRAKQVQKELQARN